MIARSLDATAISAMTSVSVFADNGIGVTPVGDSVNRPESYVEIHRLPLWLPVASRWIEDFRYELNSGFSKPCVYCTILKVCPYAAIRWVAGREQKKGSDICFFILISDCNISTSCRPVGEHLRI